MGSVPAPFGPGAAVDRDAATRHSEAALDSAWSEAGARVLRLRGTRIPVIERGAADPVEASGPVLLLDPAAGEREPGHLYLGRVAGVPVFADPGPDCADEGPRAECDGAVRWTAPLEVAAALTEVEQELVTIVLALSAWHRSQPFSPRDGAPTVPVHGGWARHDGHGGEVFPRTDPAVIVLVEHEDRLLLGSNLLWETGRFSLLAGFVEAGESAEGAVVREVAEEAGITVDRVRYVASQAWPYPRSLMLGFRARLADGEDPDALVPDPTEISELRWFTREQLRPPEPGLLLPGPLSIARRLIERWIDERQADERRVDEDGR